MNYEIVVDKNKSDDFRLDNKSLLPPSVNSNMEHVFDKIVTLPDNLVQLNILYHFEYQPKNQNKSRHVVCSSFTILRDVNGVIVKNIYSEESTKLLSKFINQKDSEIHGLIQKQHKKQFNESLTGFISSKDEDFIDIVENMLKNYEAVLRKKDVDGN